MNRAGSRMRLRSAFLGCSLLAMATAPAAAVENVDLKLVIATDVSRSIDNEEAVLQREGTAAAFASSEVVKAIQSGALGRIAVAMIDFSSPRFDRVVLDWQIVEDQTSADALAAKIRNSPRTPGRRTSISSALELGSLLIESSAKDIVATRRVIDVSGDGPNNDGNPMSEAHESTLKLGIIVNGLPIMDESANGYYRGLDQYYAGCVAGGRGAFVVVVHAFQDFGDAMRRKLILEVSQNESQIQQALREMQRDPLLSPAAAGDDGAPARPPAILRPGNNEYSQNCDRNGFGFGGF
jgi:Protein of unknown function (DUF1194)